MTRTSAYQDICARLIIVFTEANAVIEFAELLLLAFPPFGPHSLFQSHGELFMGNEAGESEENSTSGSNEVLKKMLVSVLPVRKQSTIY